MSSAAISRPHAAILSYPAAGQVNPMLDLAKLLHSQGFRVTFINTEFAHHRPLENGGRHALLASESFRFEAIPVGYASSASDSFDVKELESSVRETGAAPIGELLQKLSSSMDAPPITCVISNFLMTFAVDAERLGVPHLVFWTTSACSLLGSLQLQELIQRGYTPLKDHNCITNGYLDTTIDWIPGMREMRLRDLSSFIRTTDLDDYFLKNEMEGVDCALKASGLILNTFDHMESQVLDVLKSSFPRIYTVGPVLRLLNQIKGNPKNSLRLSLWEEDHGWKEWLNTQKDASVIYVSFGSLTTLTSEQLTEFAWGLADSNHPFMWIIRPNLLKGSSDAALPEEFIEGTKGRSFFAGWCHQSEVLSHPSIGGFLTHGGWNSMLESLCGGVPIICWPGFADQYMNCRYACKEWRIGMEIDQQVKREHIKDLVVELMEGERGQQIRKNVMKWKKLTEQATAQGGSSYTNLERLVKDMNETMEKNTIHDN
ncbi:hypothetical protein C4D60_Mb03t06410 [Musa balbisiana]|uniref:Glycosyltransferase n=1 Tax=Musa balbisiana TaxID=52838 RepID=A0A4S8J9P3_MUSBA|nr:hypothetical protein C4D60_Mb03t06410 [Musa balbisiana]